MNSRLTDLRKEILRVIDKGKKPLSTKMIATRIESRPNLSTIYRALDFLETQRLLRSVSFSGVKFYFASKKGNGHFLFCKECHEILEFDDCVVGNLQKEIQKRYDYKVTEHILYFRGLCSECRNYLNKKARTKT